MKDIASKIIGALPIVGLLYRLINEEGGVAGERIDFAEFCKRVENRCPPEASMAFYEFRDRHGKVSPSDICNQFLLFAVIFLSWVVVLFFFADGKPSFCADVVLGRRCRGRAGEVG